MKDEIIRLQNHIMDLNSYIAELEKNKSLSDEIIKLSNETIALLESIIKLRDDKILLLQNQTNGN